MQEIKAKCKVGKQMPLGGDEMCKTKAEICLNCGKEFYYDPHNGKKRKYCSKTCAKQHHWREGMMRMDCNSKDKRIALQDRPLTADTAYYVRLWHSKGDTPEEIALTLNRSVKQIREILEGVIC